MGLRGHWSSKRMSPGDNFPNTLYRREIPCKGSSVHCKIQRIGGDQRKKLVLVYKKVPLLPIFLLRHTGPQQRMSITIKQLNIEWKVMKHPLPFGMIEFCPDCKIDHDRHWECTTEIWKDDPRVLLIEGMQETEPVDFQSIPFFEADQSKNFKCGGQPTKKRKGQSSESTLASSNERDRRRNTGEKESTSSSDPRMNT